MLHPDIREDIARRLDALLTTVPEGSRALIATHDNPDPDAIASAFALGRILEARRGCTFDLAYGGVLGRAENRAMVRTLKIPLVPMSRVDQENYEVFGLVDTQPEIGNHSLDDQFVSKQCLVCIDHHPRRVDGSTADFIDVGGEFGATSTVLAAYLYTAGVTPDPELASALFYGIKSDTRSLGRESSPADVWAYSYLIPLTDMARVGAIERPRVPRDYFTVLVRAIRRAKVFGQVAVVDLGPVYVPDLIAETADRLLTAEGIRWAIVVGEYDDAIFVSLRVSDKRYSAGKLARESIVGHEGATAGGHGSMAGARVPFLARARGETARRNARKEMLMRLAEGAGADLENEPEPFAPSLDTGTWTESGQKASRPLKVSAPRAKS